MKANKFLVPALAVTFTGVAFGQADECAAATDLGTGNATMAFDTNNCVDTMAPATTSAEQQCFSLSNDVWFKYTASQTGQTTFSTCNNATFDTEIGVWDGADCSTMIGLGCNDDFAGCAGLTSQITVPVVAGQTYHIQVGYWSSSGSTWGAGTLSVTEVMPPTNDDCSTAATAMLGANAFDTTAALPGLPMSCGNGDNDVWFTYTATSTMDLDIDTCGSAYDSVLEVYSGTCAAPVSIACNDDACGLQSGVTIGGVNVGDQFLIQIGGFNGAGGTGTLNITEVVPPAPNCVETLFASNNGGATGGAVYFDITVTQAVSFAGMLTNTSAAAGTPVGLTVWTAPMTSVGNETVPGAWTQVAEDDGTTLSAGDDQETVVTFLAPFNLAPGSYGIAIVGDNPTTGLQMDHDYTNGTGTNQNYASGDGVVSLALGTASNAPFTGTIFNPRVWNGELCHGAGTGGPGSNYCTANNNSTGVPAVMSASGSSSVGMNNLVLESSDMPNNAFAFFLTSQVQGFVQNPGGSEGNLCLGGAIGRYVGPGQVQNSGAMGAVSLAVDLTMHPTPTGLVSVNAGETWNFTCWFRDMAMGGGATSNFADGLEITFIN